MSKKIEKRLRRLEKRIEKHKVILVNKQDPLERIEITFDGELKFIKITSTESKEVLSTTEGL